MCKLDKSALCLGECSSNKKREPRIKSKPPINTIREGNTGKGNPSFEEEAGSWCEFEETEYRKY